MRNWIFGIITFLLLFFAIWFLYAAGSAAIQLMEENSKKVNKVIGKDYIFMKDTVRIVDYNGWNDSFTLSNGVRVSDTVIYNDSLNILK